MARNQFYTQCLLTKQENGKTSQMISWIPSDKAIKGAYINLKEWPHDVDWSGPWLVVETYSKISGDKVEVRENDYKNQRGVSDV